MLDMFMDKLKSICKSRMMPVTVVYLVLVGALVVRLFQLQIVQGQEYEQSFTKTTTKERVVEATRGNIYDAKGRLLAYNVLSYNVTFLDTGDYTDSETLNAKIHQIIQLIENNGDKLNIDFNLKIDDKGNISFDGSENEILRFKRDVYAHKSLDELTEEEKATTAEEVFEHLRNSKAKNSITFNIDSSYSKKDAYKIMSVRYAMYLNNYTKYNPLEIATNVNDNTVAAIKEYSGDISGLDIESTTTREYSSEYAYSMAQILGYTGKISEDAYKELDESGKADGYSKDDQVGKTGIEYQYESTLHGKNGAEKVQVSQSNRVVSVEQSKAATAGKDVHLSIDAELQNVAYSMVEKELASILLTKITPSNKTKVTVNGSDDILIPINAVYFALLDNGVIDISHFTADDATDIEKAVNDTFLSERKKVFKNLKSVLSYSKDMKYSSLSETEKEYIDYIYKMLVKNNVLLSSNFNNIGDSKYQDYVDNKISLGEFLKHALSQDNWVDRTVFSKADEFYDSEEIYNKLLDYIIEELSDDTEFSKMVYKVLVYDGKIQPRQICLLLFDQNVIKYNQKDYSALQNGTKSAYSFMRAKIENLEITPGQLALDPCSGSVVITDPNTGKVQAMVSYPGYDNNKLANKIDSDYYSYLTQTDSYPLLNRAIQQKTAPGSTYKMISSIASLEEGIYSVNQVVNDPGSFDKISPAPKCWKKSGHGNLNVIKAIEVSCNVYYYNVAYQLGQSGGRFVNSVALKKLNSYAAQFGFGKESGVELPNESKNTMSDTQGIQSAIGQGTNNFNPINLAKYVTGLANSGTVYNMSIIKDTDPVVDNQIEIKNSTWNAIHEGMYRVVNSASSSYKSYYKDLDVKVSGKSGTAQENKNRPDHALFVSYAPSENPEVTMSVVIPNGYTSVNAAKLASEIYKYYFADDTKKKELKEKDVKVSGNTGMSHD